MQRRLRFCDRCGYVCTHFLMRLLLRVTITVSEKPPYKGSSEAGILHLRSSLQDQRAALNQRSDGVSLGHEQLSSGAR